MRRHCEERSDAAIQKNVLNQSPGLLRCARNDENPDLFRRSLAPRGARKRRRLRRLREQQTQRFGAMVGVALDGIDTNVLQQAPQSRIFDGFGDGALA